MNYIKQIDNSTVILGEKIAEGGEGEIFKVIDCSNKICKIFKLANEKPEVIEFRDKKLEAMSEKPFGSPKVIWPSKDSFVVTKDNKENISGILMANVENKYDLNEFISNAKHKLKDQIQKDSINRENYIAKSQLELIEVILNILEVIGKLHYFDVILGDINKGNFLVTKSNRDVYFIDTDSYQIGDTFLCNVGKPEYMAPELTDYRDKRSKENELFAIAVLIFEILMYNEHPYRNSTSEETRYDKIIKNGYFAYPFTDSYGHGFGDKTKIPKNAEFYHKLIWQDKFTSELKEAFHKSFPKDYSDISKIKRTDIQTWVKVLKNYKSTLLRFVINNPINNRVIDELLPGQIGLHNILEYAKSMFRNVNRQHLFISALAGTGKTTTLKRIASEFGPKSKNDCQWLYLVFNKKNQEDAKKEIDFKYVKVNTTHGFIINEVIAKNDCFKQNNKLPTREGNKLKKILEELDLFNPYMVIEEEIENEFSLSNFEKQAIFGVFYNLRYHFRLTLEKLVKLSKAYAVDPRSDFEEISADFDEVITSYGLTVVFDEIVYLAVVNEINKINKKDTNAIIPESRDLIIEAVITINRKYKDIINFNYHEAICKACHLVLMESLPGNKRTVIFWDKVNKCNKEFELGKLCDFDDYLWWPAIMAREIAWPKYHCVLLDEVQDFNRCQLIITQELAKRGAKIIAVGDKHQSIYRFRGADGEVFDKIHRFLQNDTRRNNNNLVIDVRYGLHVNYRCSKNVINFVNDNTITKSLIACDTAVDGLAEYKSISSDELFIFLRENNDRTAILSRVNNNISSLLLELLRQGIPFTSKRDAGKKFDIVQNLQMDVRIFCEEYDLDFYKIYISDFVKEANSILTGLEQCVRNYELDVDEIKEKIKTYTFLLDLIEVLSVNEFFTSIEVLNNLLEILDLYIEKQSECPNAVILMTIHASKGSEFDTVVIIDDDSIPLPRFRLEADIEQEENLRYVGYTRAKKNLIVCSKSNAVN